MERPCQAISAVSRRVRAKVLSFPDMSDERLHGSDRAYRDCRTLADAHQQQQQLAALRTENQLLRSKISSDRQRNLAEKKEQHDKLEQLQSLLHDAQLRLNEGSEVIRKLQHHLKTCQEKVARTAPLSRQLRAHFSV